jgi:hypothetical protein
MKLTACLMIFAAFLSLSSCDYVMGERVNGNGVSKSQDRQVGDFSGVTGMGSINIIVSNGPSSSLRIEADENLLEYIETTNNNGTVEVYTREGYNINPKSGIRVYATAPAFHRLDVSGSGTIKSTGKINGKNELHTEVSGSGDIKLEVDAPRIEAEISGSGSVTMAGNTKDFSAQVSGSGDVHCFNLMSENTEIDIAGSGNAEIFASKSLDVDVAGAGDVRYKGNPTIKQSIAGSGSIRKVD